jgi:hypothetical protein
VEVDMRNDRNSTYCRNVIDIHIQIIEESISGTITIKHKKGRTVGLADLLMPLQAILNGVLFS